MAHKEVLVRCPTTTQEAQARIAYQKAVVLTWEVYEESLAQARKVYEEARVQAKEVHKEAVAQAWRVYEKSLSQNKGGRDGQA